MKIAEIYSIDKIIRELEGALQIDGSDYEERNCEVILSNVKKRINKQYMVDLTARKISDPELELGVNKASTAIFVENMAMIHAKFCGMCHIARYTNSFAIKLDDVNFMGFDSGDVKTMLRAMQIREQLPSTDKAIDAIAGKMGDINNCREKRLFLIILIAHKLGFDEICASIAEYIYYSMF